MTSPTFTERRLYRNAAALLAFQSALGTKVDDFTTVDSRSMWIREFEFDPQTEKMDEQGTTGTSRKRSEARVTVAQRPIIRMLGGATPQNVEHILRSWGGLWTGSPIQTLGVTEEINEFATVALVENVKIPNDQRIVRVIDTWINRVILRQSSGLTTLDIEAFGAARSFDRTPLNALGGITLPATFGPSAIDVFAPHQFRLFRDPAGDNDSIAIETVELEFEHGLLHEQYNDIEPQVIKEGYTSMKYRIRGVWTDETLKLTEDAETSPVVFKRFNAEWISGTKKLTIDAHNIDWVPTITGWRDGRFAEFQVEGEAYLDSSDNWVDIKLTQ